MTARESYRIVAIDEFGKHTVMAKGEPPITATISGQDVTLRYQGQLTGAPLELVIDGYATVSGIVDAHLPATYGNIELRRGK